MLQYFATLPLCGCYTFSLVILVTIVLWKFFGYTRVENTIVAVERAVEVKPKRKKCGKKGPCKKDRHKYQVITAYFTSNFMEIKAREFCNFFADRKVACCLKDLRAACDTNNEFLGEDNGLSLFLVDQKVEKLHEWLLKEVDAGAKPLNGYVFAVFSDGKPEVAGDYDKSLWKLGAQRLKKMNSNDEYETWRDDIYKLVTGKSDTGCGCNSDGSSSCDSEDEAGEEQKVVDVEDLFLQ